MTLDVSDSESIKQAVPVVSDILRDRRKQLYSVINNAGIQSVATVELIQEAQFEHLMRSMTVKLKAQTEYDSPMHCLANLWGPIAVTNAFLPLLKQYAPVGSPRIVFVSTLATYAAVPFNAIYTASKSVRNSIRIIRK